MEVVGFFLIIVVFAFAMSIITLNRQTKKQYKKLMESHNILIKSHNELVRKHNALHAKIDEMKNNVFDFLNDLKSEIK